VTAVNQTAGALPEDGARADRWAFITISVYAALWLVEQLPKKSLRFDLYEMIVMGQEWQASYWKHPPLPPWMAEIFFELFGRTTLGPAVLSVATAAASLLLVWRLGRSVFGPAGGLAALLLTLGSYYVMMPVTQFNHNLAQLPFWAATVLLYRLALREPRLWHWCLLGVVSWGLVSTKYTGALLLIAIFAHAVSTGAGRAALRTYGPYLSALLALLLFAPQLNYMLTVSDASLGFPFLGLPLADFTQRIVEPLTLAGTQIVFQAPALLLAATPWISKIFRIRSLTVRLNAPGAHDRSLLLVTFFLPPGLALLAVAVSGSQIRTESLGSMFILLGPTLLALPRSLTSIRVNWLVLGTAATIVIAPPIGSTLNGVLPQLRGDLRADTAIDYSDAARVISDDWRELTGEPLTLIAGLFTDAGQISTELPGQPSVMIDGRFAHSPWVTPERIARSGVLLLWQRTIDASCSAIPVALLFNDFRNERRFLRLDPVPVADSAVQICRLALLPAAESSSGGSSPLSPPPAANP